jgi:NAD(P)-dependent dehydrogenase (short-subunit alcohol dehydrogenase family)
MGYSFNVSFLIKDINQAVVIGAGHGIGLGLVKYLLQTTNSNILATYRIKEKANELLNIQNQRLQTKQLDPTEESQLDQLVIDKPIDLLINTVGVLENDTVTPEKSLKDINLAAQLEYFKINSIVSLLLAKSFESKMNKNSCYASITAKVGSITDNKMGGWYGYRASKAAQNMFIKNIAIEWQRKRKECIVLAIHPGTTITNLSKKYINNSPYQLHTPQETANNILTTLNGKSMADNGKFFAWNNEELPW